MSDKSFSSLQKRRGGTEAQIVLLENKSSGRVCRAKGFENRARKSPSSMPRLVLHREESDLKASNFDQSGGCAYKTA